MKLDRGRRIPGCKGRRLHRAIPACGDVLAMC
jgi:hypothetical protein